MKKTQNQKGLLPNSKEKTKSNKDLVVLASVGIKDQSESDLATTFTHNTHHNKNLADWVSANPVTQESQYINYNKKYGFTSKGKLWQEIPNERDIVRNEFRRTLLSLFQLYNKHFEVPPGNIIFTGANGGKELAIIKDQYPSSNIVGVDFSSDAINHLNTTIGGPYTKGFVGNMTDLYARDELFKHDHLGKKELFDMYVSLRAIHCSGHKMIDAINEAKKVTKKGGYILLSVSNGYLDTSTHSITKGQYDYEKKLIDIEKPYTIAQEIKDQFTDSTVVTIDFDTEIFLLLRNTL